MDIDDAIAFLICIVPHCLQNATTVGNGVCRFVNRMKLNFNLTK